MSTKLRNVWAGSKAVLTRLGLPLALALTLAACSGGGGNSIGPSASVASVEIVQTGVLFTGAGQVSQLNAKALDAAGNEIASTVTWDFSKPGVIAVDAAGIATSLVANGSTQVKARVGSVESMPILAVATPIAPNVVLLKDSQIVAGPVVTSPGALPSFDNTYQVSLTGVSAPSVGDIVLNTETKLVAGRVLAVEDRGRQIEVVLQMVAINDVFPSLELDESIDLTNAPIEVAEDVLVDYVVKRSGGTFEFTPRAEGNLLRKFVQRVFPKAQQSGTVSLFGKSCKGSIEPSPATSELPILFDAPPVFSISIPSRLSIRHWKANRLERLVLIADPNVKFEATARITAAFEGLIRCNKILFTIRVPLGPLSPIVSALVPIGVGFEVAGRFTAATMSIGAKSETTSHAEIGIVCPPGGTCQFQSDLNQFKTKIAPVVDLPSIGDVRVEPSLKASATVTMSFGNPLFTALRFDAFGFEVGPKLGASFAPYRTQIVDPTYASDYKLSVEAKANILPGLRDAARLLFYLHVVKTSIIHGHAEMDLTTSGVFSIASNAIARSSSRASSELKTLLWKHFSRNSSQICSTGLSSGA